MKVKRNIGSDEHLKRALKSHISFNSLRVGSKVLMGINSTLPIQCIFKGDRLYKVPYLKLCPFENEIR